MADFMQRTLPDFVGFQEDIIKMNTLAGNSIKDTHLIPTYQKLLIEEVEEMQSGFNDKDPLEFLDGLIDFGVIGIYLFSLQQGKTPYPMNMYGSMEHFNFSNLVANCCSNAKRGTPESISIGLADWETICMNVKADITAGFKEVMRSNMSKFPLKGAVDIKKEIEYIESQGRYSDIICEEKKFEGDVYLVFKARKDLKNDVDFGDNPKFVKPSSFIEPDLTKCLFKEEK